MTLKKNKEKQKRYNKQPRFRGKEDMNRKSRKKAKTVLKLQPDNEDVVVSLILDEQRVEGNEAE